MRACCRCFGGFEQGRLTTVIRHYLMSGLSFDAFVQRPLILLPFETSTAVVTSALLDGYMLVKSLFEGLRQKCPCALGRLSDTTPRPTHKRNVAQVDQSPDARRTPQCPDGEG
jgi:hypothetical protein